MRQVLRATPIDMFSPEFRAAFEFAFSAVHGRQPFREEAEWLSALIWNENAGGKSVYNWNIGNRVPERGGDYWVPSWADESRSDASLTARELSVRKRLLAGEQVPSQFGAYKDLKTGLAAFMALFARPTHQRILAAARHDDPDEFVRAVGTPHPTTGMRYCVECNTPAHRDSYAAERMRFRNAGVFSGLPISPKDWAPRGPASVRS